MGRGRPTENIERKTKYNLVFHEYPSKPELGETHTWYFDESKALNGPYKVDVSYPKGFKPPKVTPQKGKAYGKMPVVMVFKSSNRSNARIKMKVWKNENIDYILSTPKLPGVPDKAVILEVGVGNSFIESYRKKYDL
jgi:hypothetical protein